MWSYISTSVTVKVQPADLHNVPGLGILKHPQAPHLQPETVGAILRLLN